MTNVTIPPRPNAVTEDSSLLTILSEQLQQGVIIFSGLAPDLMIERANPVAMQELIIATPPVVLPMSAKDGLRPDFLESLLNACSQLGDSEEVATFDYARTGEEAIWGLRLRNHPQGYVLISSNETEKRRSSLFARLSNDLLSAFIDGVRDYAVFMLNTEGRVISWNSGAMRLMGVDFQASKNAHVASFFEGDIGAEPVMNGYLEAVKMGGQFKQRARVIGGDNRRFEAIVSIRPLKSPQGMVKGFAGIIHDLTERLDSENTIRHSQEMFRDFAESASDWFWETDPGLKITYVSPSFEKATGIAPDFLIGRARYQIGDMAVEQEAWWEHLRKLVGHKAFRNFRYVMPLPDGRRLHVADSGRPMFDHQGRFSGFRGAGNDITAQIEADERMKAIEKRFFNAMDSAPDGIVLFDNEGRLLLWNRRCAELFPDLAERVRQGISYRTLIRLTVDRCDWEGSEQAQSDLKSILEVLGPDRQVELPNRQRLRLRDGRWLQITEQATPEGGVAVILSDITEMQQRDLELRQAYKMDALGQLTGGVAHDFNNLLTVIRGNLELVQPLVADKERVAKRVGNAMGAADRAAQLTQRLLAFARRQPLAPALQLLKPLIDGVIPLIRQAIGKMIAVKVELAEDLGYVLVDSGQFDNALLNLCINARDAMTAAGGEILVRVEHVLHPPSSAMALGPSWSDQRGGFAVTVQDNGHGMPPEVLSRALDPFFTTKGPGRGSGLGLSQVFGFVRQSEGTLDIQSSPDHGTKVVIYLPRAEAPGQWDGDQDGLDSGELPGGHEVILLTEDDDGARDVAATFLSDLGYQVVEAVHGREALQLIDNGLKYDLLVSDVAMPGGVNGAQLALTILSRTPDKPIILMSGFAEAIAGDDRLRLADVPIIHKPYSAETLARHVREQLDKVKIHS